MFFKKKLHNFGVLLLQSIMTIGIGILTSSKLKESKKLKEESRVKAKTDQDHLSKMERRLYITVVIMQVGFTVTLRKYCS